MIYDDLIAVAKNYLFVKETGSNSGRWCDFFNHSANVPVGSSYCATFINHCLIEVFERTGHHHDLKFSPHVMSLYRSNVEAYRFQPKPGHIMTWNHVGSDMGHCGLIIQVIDPQTVLTCEANTSPQDHIIEREGEGIYLKTRKLVQLADMKPNPAYLDPFYRGRE